jgi:putative ABC transport system permease protein
MYVLKESFLQAFHQLMSNRLRSFLSLLGIMIGIFCIIAVKSATNSLEDNVRRSFSKLGSDVIYVSKFSWNEDPGENYWKFARRPNPGFDDYKVLTNNVEKAKAVTFSSFIGMTTLKYLNNSVEQVICVTATEDYDSFHSLEYETGRYFSPNEYQMGMHRVILGNTVAKELFGDSDPIGRTVRMYGRQMTVIGVLKQSGKDLLKIYNYDQVALIPYTLAKSIVNVKTNSRFGGNLQVKAADGVSEEQLKDEVTVTLRKSRHLKPREQDNFSINSMSMFANELNTVFGAINVAGLIIGGFALLVGIFSVANIMFVSVKERTNIIGIKKALGAKQWVILLEFLTESVVLCILGGLVGLFFVWLALKGMTAISIFEMYVSPSNAITTLVIAIIAGVVAGFIPAWQAARMDPVEAIRA